MKASGFIPVLGIFISAGALADETLEDAETEAKKKNVCINARSQPYFSPITDNYVFVENGKHKYLMTIRRGCKNLRQGYNIAFTGSSRRVCSNSRAKIEYMDRNIRMPACQIRQIDAVENWNEASALVNEYERAKKKAKEEKDKKTKD